MLPLFLQFLVIDLCKYVLMIGPMSNFGVYGLVMVASAFCSYLLDSFAISPNSVFRLHVAVSPCVVSPVGSRPSVSLLLPCMLS